MTRRGFSLLAVLWTIAVLTTLSSVAITVARIGSLTTRNRFLLARADWAREACTEILLARHAQGVLREGFGPQDLGRGTWCDAAIDEPATKLNVNVADRTALARLLGVVAPGGAVDSLADAVLAWRGRGAFADVEQLREVPGFTDALIARLSPFLTTRGKGSIDVNAAPREVLAALPGMTDEAVDVIIARRDASQLTNPDMLVSWLSPSARATLLANYPPFLRAAAFSPPEFVALIRGGVRGTSLAARVALTFVPLGGRIAVIRRETD